MLPKQAVGNAWRQYPGKHKKNNSVTIQNRILMERDPAYARRFALDLQVISNGMTMLDFWTPDKIRKAAQECDSKEDFKLGYRGAYESAKQRHMRLRFKKTVAQTIKTPTS